MKVIYVHHAERDVSSNVEKQEQDITEAGMKEAFLLAEKLKQLKVTAIYTSPYLRCKHTAEILNQYIQVPIYEESRFNEKDKNESWRECQERNMEAIDDLVNTYQEDDDLVICVTSGVNLSAFIFYFTKIKASNENPWIQAVACSPVLFSTSDKVL